MNKIAVFTLFLLGLTGCISAPIDVYRNEENKGQVVEFPSADQWMKRASYNVIIDYNKLYDSKEARKNKLSTGITRGFQAIYSLPHFYAFGRASGNVRYETMTINHSDQMCHPDSLEIMRSRWKTSDWSRNLKICKLSNWDKVEDISFSNAVIFDDELNSILTNEPASFDVTNDGKYKTYSTEMVATSVKNPSDLKFSMGGGRSFKMSGDSNDQNYVSRLISSYQVNGQSKWTTKAELLHSVIGVYKDGPNWGPIISNLEMVKYFRTHIPVLSKEEYSELTKRVVEKFEKFELESLVNTCALYSYDLCIQRDPKDATEALYSDPRMPEQMGRYLVTSSVLLEGSSKDPNRLNEFNQSSFAVSKANHYLLKTWSWILIDHTEVKPKRNGDKVEVEFSIEFEKALKAYRLLKVK